MALATSKFLDTGPVWQQPCFKIVLRRMRIEPWLNPDPISHLRARIASIRELRGIAAGINVCQSDHGVVRSEQKLDFAF